MKKPTRHKPKHKRQHTGVVSQRLAAIKTSKTIAKRNARLAKDPEFRAAYEARKAAYLEAQRSASETT